MHADSESYRRVSLVPSAVESLSAVQAAAILGVTRRTVYRWVAQGRLPWPIVLDPLSLPTPRRRGPQRSPWSARYMRGRHTFRAVEQ